jgi:hypothetical protein
MVIFLVWLFFIVLLFFVSTILHLSLPLNLIVNLLVFQVFDNKKRIDGHLSFSNLTKTN